MAVKDMIRFGRRMIKHGPKRLAKRWIKKKIRKASGKKTTSVIRGGKLTAKATKAYGTPGIRKGGRHDIVPGRTIIEWRSHPELGRGKVLALLPGSALDVLFELGGRPPQGVPIEDVRVLV